MRYLLEVTYKGTNYAGFQIQKNAVTIQSKVEDALHTFYQKTFKLTGSSRTDAGVHALQNFFHFDTEVKVDASHLYNINAILPADIVVKKVQQVSDDFHCRFGAVSREYKYYIYTTKNPFIEETAWFYPYPVNIKSLQKAAAIVQDASNFSAFSKKNVQVNNFKCHIKESCWQVDRDRIIYSVTANRFLRGMVRALVATMLNVGRGKYTIEEFNSIFMESNTAIVDFSAPPHGLFLVSVCYPENDQC